MTNLSKAIIEVMKSVKGIEKNTSVGSGQNSYKGVADKDVKKQIGDAMAKSGLCILPIGVEATTEVTRWEEVYNGVSKPKQSVMTKVTTKYLLLHESGESMEIVGYGHGVDSQDKSAGKATTYALKYALLYTFLVPTGEIDDSDNHHSHEAPVPATKIDNRIELIEKDANWNKVIEGLKGGYTMPQVEAKYKMSDITRNNLLAQVI